MYLLTSTHLLDVPEMPSTLHLANKSAPWFSLLNLDPPLLKHTFSQHLWFTFGFRRRFWFCVCVKKKKPSGIKAFDDNTL